MSGKSFFTFLTVSRAKIYPDLEIGPKFWEKIIFQNSEVLCIIKSKIQKFSKNFIMGVILHKNIISSFCLKNEDCSFIKMHMSPKTCTQC